MLNPGTHVATVTMPGFIVCTKNVLIGLGQTTRIGVMLEIDPNLQGSVALSGAADPQPWLVESRDRGRIRVEVSGDGQPLAGAAVVVMNADVLCFRATDSQGVAEFSQVLPGDYSVTVSARDWETRAWSDIWVGSSHLATVQAQLSQEGTGQQAAVTSDSATPRAERDPFPEPVSAGRLTFNVFDSSGRQASGAVCIVVGGGHIFIDFTDSSGLTVFDGLPFGSYIVQVHKDGFADWNADYDMRQASPEPLLIRLQAATEQAGGSPAPQSDEAPGALEIIVFRADGSPAAYEPVFLVSHNLMILIYSVTDGLGEVGFNSLEPGDYYLFIQGAQPEEVEITAGQTVEISGVVGD